MFKRLVILYYFWPPFNENMATGHDINTRLSIQPILYGSEK